MKWTVSLKMKLGTEKEEYKTEVDLSKPVREVLAQLEAVADMVSEKVNEAKSAIIESSRKDFSARLKKERK